MKLSTISIIAAFSVFLVTLFSHYSFTLGAPIYSMLGAFLLCIFTMQTVTYKITVSKSLLLCLILSLVLLSFFAAIANSAPSAYTKATVFLFVSLILIIFMDNHYLSIERLKFITKIVLFVHLLFFYIQFIAYYGLDISVDFVNFITGENSRNTGGYFKLFGKDLFRASGVFTEPGNYANFIAVFFSFYSYICNLNKDKPSFKFLISICLSLILSFSVFGFVFLIVIATSYLLTEIKGIKKYLLNFTFIILIVYYIFLPYLLNRFTENSASTILENSTYLMYLNYVDYLTSRSALDFFIGNGLFNDVDIKGIALNDMTLLVFIFYVSGIIGTTLFLTFTFHLAFKLKFDPKILVFLLILLLSKLSITYMFTILLLSLATSVNVQKSSRK